MLQINNQISFQKESTDCEHIFRLNRVCWLLLSLVFVLFFYQHLKTDVSECECVSILKSSFIITTKEKSNKIFVRITNLKKKRGGEKYFVYFR